jgi:hypothetical protein
MMMSVAVILLVSTQQHQKTAVSLPKVQAAQDVHPKTYASLTSRVFLLMPLLVEAMPLSPM